MASVDSNADSGIYIVNFSNTSLDELYSLYAETVLPNVQTSDVGAALTDYVTRIIEPVGWNAVWKTPKQVSSKGDSQGPSDSEFLVEVHDVSMKKLEATVTVLEILKREDSEKEPLCKEWLESLMEIDVPLIQLYPLRDPDGMYLGTAKAIHTVRFFYENLWRPWDEDDDEGTFVERHLRSRLEFYFDLTNGGLPEGMECRCHDLLAEAGDVRNRLEQVQSQMALSDSEEELLEEDVRRCVQLHMKMESIQRDMEILENPLLRHLMFKEDISERQVDRDEPVVHVVSKRITLGMIKNLPLEENMVLQIHGTVEAALSASISGDTVLILPGTYRMGPIPWLEQDLTVKGLGQVVLEAAVGSGDLFFSCCAKSLLLSDLQLRPSDAMHAAIMVHQGCLVVKRCTLRGAKNALVVLESASVHMEECKIEESLGDAIQLRAGARCSLRSCSIYECHGSAVRVDSQDPSKTDCTHLTITNCSLNNNDQFAVLAECDANLIQPEENVTWEKLKSLPFLELSVESVEMAGNKRGQLGLFPSQSKSTPVVSSPEEFSNYHFLRLPKPLFPNLSDSDES